MTASVPAISFSAFSSSTGSSGSASICSRVSAEPNVKLRSIAAVTLSICTVAESDIDFSIIVMVRLFSPLAILRSGITVGWKPSISTRTEYLPAARLSIVTTPRSAVRVTIGAGDFVASSMPVTVTVAPGRIPPV